jgi:hypothetical protein
MNRLLATLVMVALSAPMSLGQGGMSMSSPQSAPMMASPQAGGRGTIAISGPPAGGRFFGRGHGHRFDRGPVFVYGAPYYYPEYYEPYETEAPAPPVPAPESAPATRNEPLPDAVLLELHGNQWVRVKDFATTPASAAPVQAAAISKEAAPAILVFRDGHTEEVSSYSIIDGAIYTKADYWIEGAWSRKIEIADLDIPATLKHNQQRGVKFDLPSGPNEVVIRP